MKPKTTSKPLSIKSASQTRPVGGRQESDPLTYDHPYPSMAEFAKRLALRHDAPRTRHAYYRDVRLIHEHFQHDPAKLSEVQVRDYLLHVKIIKNWKPKTIRQTVASAKIFFVEQLGHHEWTVFSQVSTKDHDELPPVLTRKQVHDLLCHVRLRRYRTPLKLIYCCGLRISECLGLTVRDVLGDENKLWVRQSKGNKDRMVPLPTAMVEDLRRYWRFHRNPLLLFPNAGRGDQSQEQLRKRMGTATTPMPIGSLQKLVVMARQELNLPAATVHTLRHSFATHLLEAGASLHTIQAVLGHKQINTTMVYLHLTHQGAQDALRLMEGLCQDLPR
jgi:integrase/recombinase XerD